MGRLIDADALREHWHISEKCEECHWNNRDCSKPPYYSLHDICEGIDEVPNIDAIPVEWLRKEMEKVNQAFEPHFAFMYVLQEWARTKSIEQLQAESEMKDWKAEQEDKNGREMETL